MPSTASDPAMNEPIADIPSAAPARPLRAILYPSRQVTTEAASPGMFRRIDVVEPPYMAPQKIPASMITAETGSIFRVIGSSSAIVAGGPRPGRTPIAVPSTAPMAQ